MVVQRNYCSVVDHYSCITFDIHQYIVRKGSKGNIEQHVALLAMRVVI